MANSNPCTSWLFSSDSSRSNPSAPSPSDPNEE
jgi:hypothetical protein